MSYPIKPGDTFTAKTIGTYPELPDWSLDPPDCNPDFWATRQWDDLPEGVSDLITFHGPKGTVVMAYGGGTFTHYAEEYGGTILRQSRWDHLTSTWKDVMSL